MRCAELTGDTEQSQIKNVQNASIIITTPEKWDSVTRKWKDHAKLMELVKLFLIDEVHVLNEERGATLEAVVSRMKSVGSNVRFIAASATVPNSDDIAEWLGKDSMNQDSPANQERFGEEFRPVLLQKHVCGYRSTSNDWALNRVLDGKLPDIISKYSQKKPIMVFCCTRKDTACTARVLAEWWSKLTPRERYWEAPLRQILVSDQNLKSCVSAAVAFHHAGLEQKDREAVEDGFLKGNINVICCTSTLAVGVNLPCHFVIVKNTVTYGDKGLREYSDLEIMQMVGRAGRPQFDKSAVAVIMTRQAKAKHYELMVSGQEILESRLHRNLIEHLNAEIGLGTIRDLSTAGKWLRRTFLFVRMKRNPEHYRLNDDSSSGDMDQRLEQICNRDIALLHDYKFIAGDDHFKSTDYGDAMARYCVQFETAKSFLALPPKAKLSEILAAVAQAVEFKDIRFRPGEKQAYRDLNKSPMIKFPIHANLDLAAHKVSLVIQSQLGAVDLPIDEDKQTSKGQFLVDVNVVFQHVHRLIRCIIDFLLCSDDSVALRNALMLCRSLGGRCWDDSPLTMRQVEGIGPAAVRKLVNANIRSVDELVNSEPHKIEMALGRHPPFGMQMLQKLKNFPILRVDLAIVGKPIISSGLGATVTVRADIGFMNEKPPETYRQSIYVIFLAETSNGQKAHFARISARKVGNGRDMKFAVTLVDSSQFIVCHVMCEDLAGTLTSATLKPSGISQSAWPTTVNSKTRTSEVIDFAETVKSSGLEGDDDMSEDFGFDLDDDDLLQAARGTDDFQHIDSILDSDAKDVKQNTTANSGRKRQLPDGLQLPHVLSGRRACYHTCKNKTRCKHSCCREGAKRPPKPKYTPSLEKAVTRRGQSHTKSLENYQTQLELSTARDNIGELQQIDLAKQSASESMPQRRRKELKPLEHFVPHCRPPPKVSLPRALIKEVVRSLYGYGARPLPLECDDTLERKSPSAFGQPQPPQATMSRVPEDYEDDFEGSDSIIEEAMVGVADSHALRGHRLDVAYEADSLNGRMIEEIDDTAELYECHDVLLSHRTSGPHTTAMEVPDQSKYFFIGPNEVNGTNGGLFSPVRAQKRNADIQERAETNSKRSRLFSRAEKEDDNIKDISETRFVAGADKLAEGKARTKEAINQWILQEFGECVALI